MSFRSRIFDETRENEKYIMEYFHANKKKINKSKRKKNISFHTGSGCGITTQSNSRPSSRMAVMGRTLTSLSRRPSSGSQEQLPAIENSSPQIRAYGPDGRHHNHELLHAASSYPPNRSSRLVLFTIKKKISKIHL